MLKEQYVNYDTAIMLKNRGFNAPCGAYYSEFVDDWKTLQFWKCGKPKTYDEVKNSGYLLVPTQSIARRWLREERKVDIEIRGYWKLDPEYYIDHYMFELHYTNAPSHSINERYATYEDACEAAIKYCVENVI